ncbi:MAG: hypothetical protein JXA09_02035 [Anaerolineae bacterium]|nr:hypothetical protein [Anaerolineae bacterium]
MRVRRHVSLPVRIGIFVLLLALPLLVVRGLRYYPGYGEAIEVPYPDPANIALPERAVSSLAAVEYERRTGKVVVDRAHENLVSDTELNLLLSWITRRGMDTAMLGEGDDLSDALRAAGGFVVVAPHRAYTQDEIATLERFVREGGRVLLAADPSRYRYRVLEDDEFGESYVIESDVPAINSLASGFGLAFADDYLYNVADNDGNYQYVVVRNYRAHPVTADLQEIVLYAAHSLIASEEVIARAGPKTLSSLSGLGGGLGVIGVGGGGNVVAIGDFTLMTEPYSGARHNSRLVANIASFLTGAERTFGLSEFPLFLGEEIELLSVAAPPADGALQGAAIREASRIQAAVEGAGKTLHWREAAGAGHDTVYLGLYEGLAHWPEVAEILAQDGITFTLETAERAREALASPTREARATPEASETPTPDPDPPRDWVHVPRFGAVDAKQTVLYYLDEREGRQLLVVLAFDEGAVRAATDRLLAGDLAGCLIEQDREGDPEVPSIALCPVAYEPVAPPQTPTTPTPVAGDQGGEPGPSTGVSVLIVADDDGEGTYEWWSSAYLFYDIVTAAGYAANVWSTSYDGPLDAEQLSPHGVVLWCAGDYQQEGGIPSPDERDMLSDYLDGGGSLLLIGAFLGDPEEAERGLVLDVEIAAGDHPLAAGLAEGTVVVLERFSAEEDYDATILSDAEGDVVVWRRGPASELTGAAVLLATEWEGTRLVQMGVPLYLLSHDDGTALGSAILSWLAGAE